MGEPVVADPQRQMVFQCFSRSWELSGTTCRSTPCCRTGRCDSEVPGIAIKVRICTYQPVEGSEEDLPIWKNIGKAMPIVGLP